MLAALPSVADAVKNATEADCRAAIARVGWVIPGGWPARPTKVVAMLTEADYAVTLDDLADFGRRGLMRLPAGGLWTAHDALSLVGLLEIRRQWVPGTDHDVKRPPTDRSLAHARAAGPEAVAAMLAEWRDGAPAHDVRALLIMLAETDNRAMRETLRTYLQLVLEGEHGVRG